VQTGVALKRIAVYLDEDEVTDQVSSLKKDCSEPYLSGDDEGLGLECATFKWNEVIEVTEKGKKLNQNKTSSSSTFSSEVTDDEASAMIDNVSDESIVGERGERVFELRNITIRFPERKLTVITGPTASGKTALLVSFSNFSIFSP
jgi:hypothetical protein